MMSNRPDPAEALSAFANGERSINEIATRAGIISRKIRNNQGDVAGQSAPVLKGMLPISPFHTHLKETILMTWKPLAHVADVSSGNVKACRVDNIPIALYNLDGEFFATHDICTHAHACLSDGYLEDGKIECPMHQGVFDVRTGKALSGPVDVDIRTFAVRIDGDEVQVDVE
ncbi:hypothetical protein BTHE68_44850 [Burkholderia sp. THE68]|uniref:non-heme iron oxygenase ferredoxin subunit n=1 Tax=Burkholderia sp. THE68 TaxID=758782 RepID=UPI00131620DE|nr:non-heme iron oxygenase ferredoxin subunit [Burkholderia sp. THE68]BBU30751.1 hypothetical protein BTHE68_44850 [Burkholderia sp. THE68]